MLRHRPATKQDIRYVMKNLSDVSAGEVETAGYTLSDATALMLNAMRSGEAIAFLDRATPIAIMVFEPAVDGVTTTMFLATEDFFGGRPRPTLFLKRFVDRRFEKNPGLVLRSTTFSNHPKLIRWYDIIGGKLVGQDGTMSIFERTGSLSA